MRLCWQNSPSFTSDPLLTRVHMVGRFPLRRPGWNPTFPRDQWEDLCQREGSSENGDPGGTWCCVRSTWCPWPLKNTGPLTVCGTGTNAQEIISARWKRTLPVMLRPRQPLGGLLKGTGIRRHEAWSAACITSPSVYICSRGYRAMMDRCYRVPVLKLTYRSANMFPLSVNILHYSLGQLLIQRLLFDLSEPSRTKYRRDTIFFLHFREWQSLMCSYIHWISYQ